MLSATRRSVLSKNLRYSALASTSKRAYSAKQPSPQPEEKSSGASEKAYEYKKPTPPPETWLAQYLRRSPRALNVFQSVTGALGMGNPRQVAGRISFHYYQNACAVREVEERDFWHQECRLPPTFQTWFTVTNLHVWLLTVRFRALPSPYGENFVQGLVDHFFLDVEDRIRQALSQKAPERLVSRQMKILREQWAGLNLALDYALGLSSPYAASVSALKSGDGDAEMAAAVWRNFLGARGANGIDDPGPGRVRHAVNISGEYGKEKLSKERPEDSLRKLEETDDGSGVYDFVGKDVRLYVRYPELMYTLVKYIRKELVRLESISDAQIMKGEGVGKFGKVADSNV
ncbi:ubiquinol-cytochrome C chaperone-domain-containing protein [Phellopilus nigrolimitatus]|nr:ubiquinol-cytochrome C chaperone-domain-containing protein [Phellopilus nigrolimitatus]